MPDGRADGSRHVDQLSILPPPDNTFLELKS
jgi:hypothetical protein